MKPIIPQQETSGNYNIDIWPAWSIAFQCSTTDSVNRFMDGRGSAIVSVTTEFLFSPPLCAFAIRPVIQPKV